MLFAPTYLHKQKQNGQGDNPLILNHLNHDHELSPDTDINTTMPTNLCNIPVWWNSIALFVLTLFFQKCFRFHRVVELFIPGSYWRISMQVSLFFKPPLQWSFWIISRLTKKFQWVCYRKIFYFSSNVNTICHFRIMPFSIITDKGSTRKEVLGLWDSL